jgi:AraC-like DNA-binding protein
LDPLSQVIGLLKPQAVAWKVIEGHDGWRLRLPTADLVIFGQAIQGRCRATLGDGRVLDVEEGDFLLMPAPRSWMVSTTDSGSILDLKAVLADPSILLSDASEPVITRLITGAFTFAAPNADLMMGLLPAVVHIRAADVAAGRLGALLALLGEEAITERPGRSLVLDRLLEILLIEALRRQPVGLGGEGQGLLPGLADPRIGAALQIMHRDVQRAWTVSDLARHAGMSRSAFAARFAEIVGAPPIDYLLNWRMALAKAALSGPKKPMAEIAELAGYASVSAFSTAFSRAAGRSPTAYSRMTHWAPLAAEGSTG